MSEVTGTLGTHVTPWTESDDVGLVRVRMLRVVHGPTRQGRWPLALLEGEPVAIGREGEVKKPHTQNEHEETHQHAKDEPESDGSWRLVDRGSRNGTTVDGARIT